jgi:hypothetical protein
MNSGHVADIVDAPQMPVTAISPSTELQASELQVLSRLRDRSRAPRDRPSAPQERTPKRIRSKRADGERHLATGPDPRHGSELMSQANVFSLKSTSHHSPAAKAAERLIYSVTRVAAEMLIDCHAGVCEWALVFSATAPAEARNLLSNKTRHIRATGKCCDLVCPSSLQ